MTAKIILGVDFKARRFQQEAERAVAEELFGDLPLVQPNPTAPVDFVAPDKDSA